MGKQARRGFRGYPLATIAFYGPTTERASKVAVSIFPVERGEPSLLERWFSEDTAVRHNSIVGGKVLAFLRLHQARSVVVADGIIGCPHEEGIDYPEGRSCPLCPDWAGRDRFTHERIH